MKRILAPILLVVFLFPSLAMGETKKLAKEEFLLICQIGKNGDDETYFVINPQLRIAKFMNPEVVVIGSLTTLENNYVLHFAKTQNRYETLVKINRYSGKLAWEHGQPPFGEENIKNIFRSGVCSKDKNITRF